MRRSGQRLWGLRRTRWLTGVVMAVVVAVAVGLALRSGDRVAASSSGESSRPQATKARERAPLPRLIPSDPVPGFPRETALARADDGPGPHIEHYRGRSGRLASGRSAVPAFPTTVITSELRSPALEVWVPSIRVLETGTTVHARVLLDPAEPATFAPPVVAIGLADRGAPSEFSAMKPADKHEFVARFVPPPPGEFAPPRAFRYLVRVTGQRAGERFERQAGGQFFVHDPGARIAGAPKVEPRDGDVVLTLPIEVKRAGRYFAYAELWGGKAAGEAIAFARDRLTNVAVGAQTVTLRFGGRILRDAGVDGPYVVRNLRLQQVDTHPAHESDPGAELPPTPAWPASGFR